MTNAPRTNRTASPSYEDMLEAFIDAAASAGLSPVDDLDAIPEWIAQCGWDAVRHNGDSFTLARLVADDERIDYAVTTKVGVIHLELSFPVSRLGVRAFETVAALYP
jgi:hypothetical protein